MKFRNPEETAARFQREYFSQLFDEPGFDKELQALAPTWFKAMKRRDPVIDFDPLVDWILGVETEEEEDPFVFSLLKKRAEEAEAAYSELGPRQLRYVTSLKEGFHKLVERWILYPEWLRHRTYSRLKAYGWFLIDGPSSTEVISDAWVIAKRNDFYFTYPNWNGDRDFEDYAAEVRNALEDELLEYKRSSVERFKKKGYVESRKVELTPITWLLRWNLSGFENLWEILSRLEEFETVDLNNSGQLKSATDRLSKAFEKLRKHGLPVRPWRMQGVRRSKTSRPK